MKRLTTNRGFWLSFLLSIVTLGIYALYLVYAFARETNIACAEDGKRTYGLVACILLSIITFGIYAIVWECMLINRRCSYLARHGKPEGLQLSTYLLTLFIFGWLTLGVMYIVVFCKDLYQQNAVNRTYNELNSL
jgi:ABC-type Na+ efflux pump permease subunit